MVGEPSSLVMQFSLRLTPAPFSMCRIPLWRPNGTNMVHGKPFTSRERMEKALSRLVMLFSSARTLGDLLKLMETKFSAGGLSQEIGKVLLWRSSRGDS